MPNIRLAIQGNCKLTDGKPGIRTRVAQDTWVDGGCIDDNAEDMVFGIAKGKNARYWPAVGIVIEVERTENGIRGEGKVVGRIDAKQAAQWAASDLATRRAADMAKKEAKLREWDALTESLDPVARAYRMANSFERPHLLAAIIAKVVGSPTR
jgi:hypothetical protein